MTLVIALKRFTGDGRVVMSAYDPRISVGYLAYGVRKMHPIAFKSSEEYVSLSIAGEFGILS